MTFISGCASTEKNNDTTNSNSAAKKEATSQQLPSLIQMAVLPEGMTTNTIGTGIANMLVKQTPMNVQIRVTQGGNAARMVNSGQTELLTNQSRNDYDAYNGTGTFKNEPQKNLRLIAAGPTMPISFVVKKDSPYKDVRDLKGVKVAGDYAGSPQAYIDGAALLATAGMTWKDVNVVPVSNNPDGMQALMEGRVEAALSSVTSASVEQANASIDGGVRILSVVDDTDALYSSEFGKGYWIVKLNKGSSTGVVEDTNALALRITLGTHSEVKDEVTYAVTKALWNNVSSLGGVHPLFKKWTTDIFALPEVTLPYHPGAIRFYKEVGVWSEEMEKAQQQLLQK